LSRVLKYSRHLVTIDAPSERRLFPSDESSGEDIFIWFRRADELKKVVEGGVEHTQLYAAC